MPDEEINKSQNYRRRMQRRHVAWKTAPPPTTATQATENHNPITSVSQTVGVINKFTPVASFNKKTPLSYTISSKHYGVDGSGVANSILRRASKKRRYEEKIIIGNAAVDSHQRHRFVNDRVVKRFQMNHKENSPSKFGMNIFNRKCFHLSEYNFSRSTIQFLSALCQQGKSLNVYSAYGLGGEAGGVARAQSILPCQHNKNINTRCWCL